MHIQDRRSEKNGISLCANDEEKKQNAIFLLDLFFRRETKRISVCHFHNLLLQLVSFHILYTNADIYWNVRSRIFVTYLPFCKGELCQMKNKKNMYPILHQWIFVFPFYFHSSHLFAQFIQINGIFSLHHNNDQKIVYS